LTPKHAHHQEEGALNADVLANGFFVFLKEYLTHLRTDHGHLAAVADVEVVDETAAAELHGPHAGEVGVFAVDVEGFVFGAPVHGVVARQEVARRQDGYFGNGAPDGVHVVVGELHEAAGLKALVGNAGALRPHEHAVFGNVEAGNHAVFEAVARPEQHHQHKDAPEHAKRRQERP
jgi:hypothetical protein